MTTAVDLSKLPPPKLLTPDAEASLLRMLAKLRSLWTEFDANYESEPSYQILQTGAYREMLGDARINTNVEAVLLAKATGSNLRNLAAAFGVEARVVTPGDPTAVPPTEDVYEDDDVLRQRAASAPEGYTTAGSLGAYDWHARNASVMVRDVDVTSPSPAAIQVVVLSTAADGTTPQALLNTVAAAIGNDNTRPAGDRVTVIAAQIVRYDVTAALTIPAGPDPAIVLAEARASLDRYTQAQGRIGQTVDRLVLGASLVVPGVEGLALTAPAADVAVTAVQAALVENISITQAM